MKHSREEFDLLTPAHVLEKASNELSSKTFAIIPGQELFSALNIDLKHWSSFASSWANLTLDHHMADNGLYRFRRYGELRYSSKAKSFERMPHRPYIQPLDVNPLNGDVERLFDPLESNFVDSPILQSVLHAMVSIYNRVDGMESDWSVCLHPYRIVGSANNNGKPTPEGLHRDGVTYIASMLASRCDITGGRTRLTSNLGEPITSLELKYPMDLLLSDDAKTMHEVSEIRPMVANDPAYRDVLVIAFTRLNQEQAHQKGEDIRNEG